MGTWCCTSRPDRWWSECKPWKPNRFGGSPGTRYEFTWCTRQAPWKPECAPTYYRVVSTWGRTTAIATNARMSTQMSLRASPPKGGDLRPSRVTRWWSALWPPHCLPLSSVCNFSNRIGCLSIAWCNVPIASMIAWILPMITAASTLTLPVHDQGPIILTGTPSQDTRFCTPFFVFL